MRHRSGGSFLEPNGTPALAFAATNGAPLLASFTDGLRAAHNAASNVRFTVLGHSYGSTTVGVAAQKRPGAFADQLIFVGSPGVTAAGGKDLKVGSVLVGEAPNDPVGDIGSVIPALGPDPSSQVFGAQSFYVPDSGDSVISFKGHSSYWAGSSKSLSNIAHVINGEYGSVIRYAEPSASSTVTPPPPTAPPSLSLKGSGALPTENPSPHPQPSPVPTGE
ncbi:alpha/beta hydrolase [Streptosporangium sp. NPDC051023]|uniref:alpha/beta hydrolase n=1 Tax=Streptosporangium sp. NPDC051023 TaxID=3155410 RepID=UPI00344D5D09